MTTLLPPDSPGSVATSQETGTHGAEPPRERRLAALLLSRYNLRYLVRLYSAFDGDLLLPIVLGEVGIYNVGGLALDEPSRLPAGIDDATLRGLPLRPCNAFSISSSTGIPRETLRRKVSHLIQLGLIDRDQKGGLTITAKAINECLQRFDADNEVDFLSTADQMRAVLGDSPTD